LMWNFTRPEKLFPRYLPGKVLVGPLVVFFGLVVNFA